MSLEAHRVPAVAALMTLVAKINSTTPVAADGSATVVDVMTDLTEVQKHVLAWASYSNGLANAAQLHPLVVANLKLSKLTEV